MLKLVGKGSTFGGPYDSPAAGNKRDDWKTEPLSIIKEEDLALSHVKGLFLTKVPKDLTGLARRLDPDRFYVAARWDYKITPRTWLRDNLVTITCLKTGRRANARPVDWGPAEWTGKTIDMSPGLMEFLGGETGDVFEMLVPQPGESLPAKNDEYKPPKDPRDNYQNAPKDPEGEGVGIVGALLGKLMLPLLTSVGGSLLKKFLDKKLKKVVKPVLEVEVPGKPGPVKEEEAVKKILPKNEGPWADLIEQVVRAVIKGVVGTLNEKYGKDWSEAQSEGLDGVLKKLLS